MVAESETVKRRIRDLRVVDLRNELESRGLDKNGVKATLVDRLTKALQDEGLDPEEFYFDTTEKKSMKKNSVGRQEHDGICDMESFVDGGDVSNANEFDDETKEEMVKDDMKDCFVADSDSSAVNYQTQLKMDLANSQENNDAVEDCINLNLEDEENFDEEENSAKEKDEQPPRRGLTRMDPQQQKNSSTVGDLLPDQASSSSNDGGNGDSTNISNSTSTTKTGLTLSSNPTAADGNGEKGNRDGGPESQYSSGTQDVTGAQSSSSTSSGEKAKSGSSGAKDAPTKIATKDDRDKKKGVGGGSTGGGSSSRNLWVSGLSTSTRATDLKNLFSKYGKVIGAKVVTNARTPGARCYGYVTMATSEDASKCIQHLHRTELHGRMISVEKAKGESGPRKPELKTDSKVAGGSDAVAEKNGATDKESDSSSSKKKDLAATTEGETTSSAVDSCVGETSVAPDNTNNANESKEDVASGGAESASQQQPVKENNSNNKGRFGNRGDRRMDRSGRRPPSPHRQRHTVLTFQHIREERERQRLREREREERQAERRRREEMARQREHERKQREEALRLKEERERLRIERERLEREKAELMRLERERQKLEREKIEAEREELRRQQARSLARIEEVRRAAATKRNAPGERDDYYVDRKRIAVDGSMRYDATPSSNRYDGPKSSIGSGQFGASASSVGSDYRGSKVSMDLGRSGTYDHQSRNRFERPPPTSSVSAGGSVISRRVVQQEISSSIRRDGRSPPSPPPPSARERADDRRVLDRGRDDRFGRGSRGQDAFSDRDRERERERLRERSGVGSGSADRGNAVRGRMHGRGGGAGNGVDHRNRYNSDGRSTKDNGSGGDHRYERSSETWRTTGGSGGSSGVGNSKSNYGNGSSGGAGITANGVSAVSSSNWQSQSSVSSDRWGSSSTSVMPPMSRTLASSGAFNSNWNTSAPPPVFSGAIGGLNSTVIGQSSTISYSSDRYSRH